MSRVSFYTRPYDRLEPYDGKLSRTVLRGGAGSNASLLPDIKTESDVLKFVNALIANTKGDGKEGDEFWTKAETLLYCALVAYIVFEGPEEERNMNTLVEMINSMEVREDDESFKNAVDYMFDGLAKRNPQHFAVRQYAKYMSRLGRDYLKVGQIMEKPAERRNDTRTKSRRGKRQKSKPRKPPFVRRILQRACSFLSAVYRRESR